VQDRTVACPYMPVGMKVCGFKVLSAVSVTVRHSLAGDRNEGMSCISLGSSNERVLISPSSRRPGDIPISKSTHSRLRAIDRQLNGCGRSVVLGWRFERVVWAFPGPPHFRNFFVS
jgi:hypothetical protein